MSDLIDARQSLSWPLERAHEALAELAAHISPVSAVPLPTITPPERTMTNVAFARWLDMAASAWQLELEPVQSEYARLPKFLQKSGPALFLLQSSGTPRLLALVGGRRDFVQLLMPDGVVRRIPLGTVLATLCHEIIAPLEGEIDRLLEAAGVSAQQHMKAKQAVLRQRLQAVTPATGWQLVLSPGVSFWQQMWREGLPGRLSAFLIVHAVQYALFLLSWWLIGRMVLQGGLSGALLLAWALLLLLLIPLRLLVNGMQASVAIRAGWLLQRRLLYGAMSLQPDEIRHLGVGQLMGGVFESEAVETLALSGGLMGLMALIELLLTGWVLSQGAAGWLHLLGLLIWLTLLGGCACTLYHRRQQWTAVRRHLTHDLIEKMVGYRTYVAQTAPDRRHEGEEEMLVDYTAVSKGMDRRITILVGGGARGWLLVGLAALIPGYLAGSVEVTAVAVSVGGILSAELALRKVGQSIVHLVGAAIAWEQIAHLFRAATHPLQGSGPATVPTPLPTNDKIPLLDGHNLTFSYPGRGGTILYGCDFRLYQGERVLITGPSGGGKSTLAALITGLRQPQIGSLQLQGVSQKDLPLALWRRSVVYTPQFHENYVLGSTFLFNLLLGQTWPPHREDVMAAEAICAELGLGDLLNRMPAGMQQTVGEIGWQLSHGERSRLYLARTLLQGAEITVLDESFAALDPETMKLALRCVLRHTPTLIVLAHF